MKRTARPRRVAIGIETEWPYKHHTAVIAGILAYGEERDWRCELAPYLEASGPVGFGARVFDGMVARVTPGLARSVRAGRIPLVNVWTDSPVREFPGVFPDHEAAGRMAARHLLERGHRRLGFLGIRGSRGGRIYLDGFRAGAAAGGAPVDTCFVHWPKFLDRAAWRRFMRDLEVWVATWKTPLGVLAMQDVLARHLADAGRAAGLRIPADVALLGVGNAETVCERWRPPLSSVEMGFERVGYEAARLLDGLMSGRAAPRSPLWIPPSRVVTRLSTCAFAVRDPIVSRALRLIATRAFRPLRVGDVAGSLYVTKRSLQRRFRRVLRRSVHDEIRRVRIERAQRLLVETDLPLKTIADRTGFRGYERLSEAFWRERGESPGAYRRDRRRD